MRFAIPMTLILESESPEAAYATLLEFEEFVQWSLPTGASSLTAGLDPDIAAELILETEDFDEIQTVVVPLPEEVDA